jgi:hypothetical protein
MQFVAGTFMAFAYSSRTPNSAPKSADADKRLSLSDSAAQQQQQMQQQQQGANSGHYKCEMCRSWTETGTCRYGPRCQFAHGAEELRPRQRGRNYKTKACRSWEETGACPYGKRCQFLHDGYENVDGAHGVETAAAFDSHATSHATGGDAYDSYSQQQQHQHQHKSASSDLPPRSGAGVAGSGGQSDSAGPSGRRRFMSSPPEMQESAVAATTAASASGYAETHRAHRGSAPAVMAYANMAKQPPPPSSQHHHQPQQQQNHHQHHQHPPQQPEQYYAHAQQHPHQNQYQHHHSGNCGGSDHRGSFQQQPQQQHHQQPHRLNPTEELLSALLTSGAFPALQDLAIALQHVAASNANANTNMNGNANGRSASIGADDSVDSFGADSLNAVSTSSASQSLLLSPQSPLLLAQTGLGSSIGRAAANVRATSSGSLSSWPSSPMHASSGFSAGAGRGSMGVSTSSDSPYPNSSPNLVSTMPHTTAPSSPHSFDASPGGSFSGGFGSGLGQAMMHPQQHGAHATSSFGAPQHRSLSFSLLGGGGGGGGSVSGHTHAPGEVAYSFQQGQQLGMNSSHQQHPQHQQQGQQPQQHYQPSHQQSSHFAPSSQLGFSGSVFDSALFLNHDGGAQSTAPTSYFAVAGDSVHDAEAASRSRLPVFQHLDANDAAASSNASAHSHATRSF